MKTKVRVPVMTTTVEEMEVEFPIYRKFKVSSKLTRIDIVGGKMRECCVKTEKDGKRVGVIVNDAYEFEPQGLDFLLGRGDFESNEAEFEGALQKVMETITYILVK